MWEMFKRVWSGKGWSEEWKDGIVVPIIEKGKGYILTEWPSLGHSIVGHVAIGHEYMPTI